MAPSKRTKGQPQPGPAEDASKMIQAVCFNIDNVVYGIDVENVEEIIRPRIVSTGDQGANYVRGTIPWHETNIPVVDLRLRLGYGVSPDESEDRLIIVESDGGVMALEVDGVTGILRLQTDVLPDIPGRPQGPDGDMLKGIFVEEDRTVRLLEAARIMEMAGGGASSETDKKAKKKKNKQRKGADHES